MSTGEDVKRLIEELRDQDREVRRRSARALGFIGPDAREAVPALVAALKDLHPDVRSECAWALGRIAPDA